MLLIVDRRSQKLSPNGSVLHEVRYKRFNETLADNNNDNRQSRIVNQVESQETGLSRAARASRAKDQAIKTPSHHTYLTNCTRYSQHRLSVTQSRACRLNQASPCKSPPRRHGCITLTSWASSRTRTRNNRVFSFTSHQRHIMPGTRCS
jgi:hypothetical protein